MNTATTYTVQIPVFVTLDLTPEIMTGHSIASFALIDAAYAALTALPLPANISIVRQRHTRDDAYDVRPA